MFTELIIVLNFFQIIPPVDCSITIALAAVEASVMAYSSAIIVITSTGRSAYHLAQFRPKCPIIAITRNLQTAKHCHLYRGILPLLFQGIRPL